MEKNKTIPFFGIQVKKRLVDLNMTQRELAAEIGVNENYLTDILKGRRAGTKYKGAIIEKLSLYDTEENRMKEVI